MNETPIIRRETDASFANRLANTSGLVPDIYRSGASFDLSAIINSCVVLSNGDDAMMIFEQTARRCWQVMTIFADTCRGKKALLVGKAMRDWMMPAHADVIFGPVPRSLPAAGWFYRQMGGKVVDRVSTRHQDFVAPSSDHQLFVLEAA